VRRAAKVDGNQAGIVRDLRLIPGCSVAVTSVVGDGFPDLVVGFRGFNFLVEIKDESQPKHRHELTEDQRAFHDAWKGQVLKAFTFKEILDFMIGRTEQ
jgi:hypothetical protein